MKIADFHDFQRSRIDHLEEALEQRLVLRTVTMLLVLYVPLIVLATHPVSPCDDQVACGSHLILPHEESNSVNDSKELLKTVDLVIAEVSHPSTGMGIELGWADMFGVKIVCIHQAGQTRLAL